MRTSISRPGDPPRIALVGPWVLNKGDDLMLRAVLARYADAAIGAPAELWPLGVPSGLVPTMLPPSPGDLRWALGQRRILALGGLAAKRVLLALDPDRTAAAFGRAPMHAVAVLLDCSGFGYGDDWPPGRMLRRCEHYRRLKARGVRLVLLPQALGPFETPAVRDAARRLLALCDLVCARDADSLAHLRALDLPATVGLRCAPDITHLLTAEPPADAAAWAGRVAIVPNARMLDRTAPERAGAYLDFLVAAIEATRGEGLDPWIVLHEANDRDLIAALNDRLPTALPVVDADAVATKGILGACRAVVASRYHAIVSALSQATPTIGTSWTHKYDRLFEEYDHADFLLRPEADAGALPARLRALVAEPERGAAIARLGAAAARAEAMVRAAWAEVDAILAAEGAASRLAP